MTQRKKVVVGSLCVGPVTLKNPDYASQTVNPSVDYTFFPMWFVIQPRVLWRCRYTGMPGKTLILDAIFNTK